MEERDVQIRGYRIRLPVDVFVVASANPEDYTNRGRIITPLKDRYGAQVRTHYPQKIEHEIGIMDAEHHPVPADFKVSVPAFMKEIIAEISRLARRSPDVNQRSGVSVRASIANYESMLANALRRSIVTGEDEVVPRVSDLPFVIPALSGKVEFETVEEGREDQIIDKLIQGAVVAVFNRYYNLGELEQVVNRFKAGVAVEVGDMTPSAEYVALVRPGGRHAGGGGEGWSRAFSSGSSRSSGVPPRGSALEQAAEQGQGRRQSAVPRIADAWTGRY
ncbi:hypothetical protein [Candidatus Amarobacter glycogenicus]|uniref:hypothetical protein n=1 Tax=Candidatus Amarobacter glycogenicus TaxID=3140699 RepID=UPI0031CC442E